MCKSVFCLLFLTSSFPSCPSRPLLPDVCLFQPSCLDDPDREQRIKELELLLMSAESEVQRQVQCRGPRVRTHSECVFAYSQHSLRVFVAYVHCKKF